VKKSASDQPDERATWIKKYPNRRLYCPVENRYLTLEDIAERIIAGKEVKIYDKITGRDITSYVFMQILARLAETGDVRFTEYELKNRIVNQQHPQLHAVA
jgi:polyhydroxyalkanoate synthesis repressor PhaR